MRVSYRVMDIPSELAIEVFKFIERAVRSSGFTPRAADLQERIGLVVDEWANTNAQLWPGEVVDRTAVVAACERLAHTLGLFFLSEKEG